MDELKIFMLSKKRTLIAMHEWLRTWQLPPVPPLRCPRCQCHKVGKLMKSQNGNTHICAECRHPFSLRDLPECRCTYPGVFADKCFDCQHYRAMMNYVERRKPALEHLNEHELDEMMAAPNFYARSLTRQSLDEAQSSSKELFNFWVAAQLDEGQSVQLGLFDNDANEDKANL